MGKLFALLGLTVPKTLATVGVPEGSDSAPPAVKPVDAAQLMQRHQKLKADLDKIIAKGGALAKSLQGQLSEFTTAVRATTFDAAAKILDRLEEVVWMDSGKTPEISGAPKSGA